MMMVEVREILTMMRFVDKRLFILLLMVMKMIYQM